jgi:hypothetical protein
MLLAHGAAQRRHSTPRAHPIKVNSFDGRMRFVLAAVTQSVDSMLITEMKLT